MIAITLNFKSIEAARQALLDIPSSDLVGGPAPEADVASPKARKAAAAATSPDTATKPAAPETKTPSSDASATASSAAAGGASEGNGVATRPAPSPTASAALSPLTSPAVEYPVLQKAVFALAGKSREAAAAVAASMGVKTFKELPQDKWADALTAVTAKLAELEAA